MTNPHETLTWQQVREATGYTEGDIDALTAQWIHEPGYLTDDGQPTQATLDLLLRQRASDCDCGLQLDDVAPTAYQAGDIVLVKADASASGEPTAAEVVEVVSVDGTNGTVVYAVDEAGARRELADWMLESAR